MAVESKTVQIKTRARLPFWERVILPSWLPLILGLMLGVAAAGLIIRQEWFILAPLALAVPIAVLFLRYPFVAVLLWLLFFPFFVRETSAEARYMYWLLHRLMIPGALAVIVLSEWLGIRKKTPVKFGGAELGMLLFLALSVANISLLTNNPQTSLLRFYDRIIVPFMIYFLVRLSRPTEKDMKRLVPIALVMVALQGAIGLLAWFAPSVLPSQWLERIGERTTGSFGNPGVFTTTLVFFGLVLTQYAIQSRSRWAHLISWPVVGVVFFLVFFSFSRGSWLGGLAVLFGLFYLYPRMMIRLALVGVLISALLGTTIFASYVEFAWNRLTTETTAEGRIVGGVATVRLIEAKPVFGWGYGNHELYDEQFRTRVFDIAVNNEHTSHNTYLLITAEMGFVGLFLYMFPVLYWLIYSFSMRKRLPKEGFAGWSFLVMMWLLLIDHFLVGNFTDMIQSNLFSTGMWWIALALIANILYPHIEKDAQIGDVEYALQKLKAGSVNHDV